MSQIVWKGKPFKSLSFGRKFEKAGRNFTGRITIFHRGGGSKKLYRRVDYERRNVAQGLVERVEYDPNRTAQIALIRWSDLTLGNFRMNFQSSLNPLSLPRAFGPGGSTEGRQRFDRKHSNKISNGTVSKRNPNSSDLLIKTQNHSNSTQRTCSFDRSNILKSSSKVAFSYILAWDDIQPGDEIYNFENLTRLNMFTSKNQLSGDVPHVTTINSLSQNDFSKEMNFKTISVKHLYQKKGVSLPLHLVPVGSMIYNVELQPGKGGQLVRAAGASAQLVKKDEMDTFNVTLSFAPSSCLIRMPSGQQQRLDSRCRVTIGTVSNVNHATRQLKKAGQKRWLGFRPVVRGVAMNPIDHPHGGGEGRTKGGRPSVSPWGKPSKGKFGSLHKFRHK